MARLAALGSALNLLRPVSQTRSSHWPYPPVNTLYTPCKPPVIPLYWNTGDIQGDYKGYRGGYCSVGTGTTRHRGYAIACM